MTTRRTHKLIWWLLPLFALRSLVPAGFMIDSSHGGLSMTICSDGIYKAVTLTEKAGQGHDAPVGAQNHEHNTICPFALAAVGATASDVLQPMLGAMPVVSTVDREVAKFYSPFGPSRTQGSRAPPYFLV